jgi:hypothetical protein
MTAPSRIVAAFPLLLLLAANRAQGQAGLEMTARIWPYASLCRFADPPDMAEIARKYRDVYEVRLAGCEFLVGHPAAVVVSLKNNGGTTLVLELNENPGDVVLTTPAGRSASAIAAKVNGISPAHPASEVSLFEFPATVGDGVAPYGFGYVTVSGTTVRELKAGARISLVYLFSVAHAGDTIKIGPLKPVKIEQAPE